jgi:hypothetical protein
MRYRALRVLSVWVIQDRTGATYQICGPAQEGRKLKRAGGRQHFPAAKAVDGHGGTVGNTERHDGSGEDGIEGTAGAQEDAAEDDDQYGGEIERIEREVEGWMDFGEDAGRRKTAISRKGICHAARGSHDASRRKEQAHQREDQQADGAGVASGRRVEDLEERAGGGIDDFVDIAGNEEEDQEEDESREDANTNTADHDFRTFNPWIGNFFNH